LEINDMHFLDIIMYLADTVAILERVTDIVVLGIMFSALVVGFFYAIALVASHRVLKLLRIF